jgi:hypothetical protein
MAIRIPQNIIIESKYTIGNEFILLLSYQVYQGYYYEINGKYFVGKEFTPDAPELQKIISPKSNSLLKIASSFIFGKISGIDINQKDTPTSVIYQPTEEDYSQGYSIRYFYKKINLTPIIIKETNQENYNLLINDPLYQVTSIKWDALRINNNNIDQAEQQMPGLKAFLGV